MVPGEGLEPSRPYGQRILSPLRLPIPPPGLWYRIGNAAGFFSENKLSVFLNAIPSRPFGRKAYLNHSQPIYLPQSNQQCSQMSLHNDGDVTRFLSLNQIKIPSDKGILVLAKARLRKHSKPV